jgi:DNA-binding Lrp family transcriptional regulator
MALIDQLDMQILALLQQDARLTNKEIASKLGKSITPVYERVKRLEKEGYIKNYVAVLDKKKLGKSLTSYTNVQLKEHSKPMLQLFETNIIEFPEVLECYHMTGAYDYLLKVVVGDITEYHDFIMNRLASLANIGTVQSSFILTEVKESTSFDLT